MDFLDAFAIVAAAEEKDFEFETKAEAEKVIKALEITFKEVGADISQNPHFKKIKSILDRWEE